jgi:FkbM family methyltransferase
MEEFHAQFGEDALLSQIFSKQERGCCLEIGALDGIQDSTTLYFERKGWFCVLIEANPELAARASINRRGPVFSCAAGASVGTINLIVEGAEPLSTTILTQTNVAQIQGSGYQTKRVSVPMLRLDDILERAGVSKLDFATVDVEGAELEVLQGFDLTRWNPRVLVVEDNTAGRDRRVRHHLYSNGYRCFLNDGLNDWYARKEDSDLLSLRRRAAEYYRQGRVRLRAGVFALLPPAIQERLRQWKRQRSSARTQADRADGTRH